MTTIEQTEKAFAPFNDNEILSINGFQRSGVFHEFTCGNEHGGRRALYATKEGLRCPNCDYTQVWVHSWMADFHWEKAQGNIREMLCLNRLV